MNKKYQPKKTIVRRESEPLPWKYSFVVILCGAVLVAGFLFAAKTHFSSFNFCVENAELKKRLADLEAEKRRLMLSKEMALAPAEIKKAARRLGLVDMSAINIAAVTEAPTAPATAPLVVKTVDSKPVAKPKTLEPAGETRDRVAQRVEKREPVNNSETRERRVSKTGK